VTGERSGLRWGIIGVGIAGRARARALRALGERCVGVHRGRFAAEVGFDVQPDAEALLQAADAVIVCSPSQTHARWIQRALDADCHVVVEYPVARTADEALMLMQRAASADKVLHVEHIERLSGTTRALVEGLDGAEDVVSEMVFTSGGEPWPDADTHLWHNVSRLHRIQAALGPIDEVQVHAADGGEVRARVVARRGRVALTLRRGPDEARGLTWDLSTGVGHWRLQGRTLVRDGTPVPVGGGGLFEEDLRVARRRIVTGGPSYVEDDAVVGILDLCARMARQVGGVISPNGSQRPV